MKGQQQALSAILISGILIGVVGSVYFWGVPLIEKNKDVALLESSEAFMRSLNGKIKFVANNGGRDQLTVALPGTVSFDGSQIEFVAMTDGTIYSANSPVPLSRNDDCTATGGAWGVDEPEVLCVVSASLSNATFRSTYSLRYIPLALDTRRFEISLSGPARSAGQDHSIIIESRGIEESESGGVTSVKTVIQVNII